jgi:cation diffusion facilitator family transporter
MPHAERHRTALRTIRWSIAGSAVLAAVKWLAGWQGQSDALIADAIESTTDIAASGLVLLGLLYARRPADANHPYGHGRVESLVTFLVVGFLTASATLIAVESVRHLGEPQAVPAAFTLWVLGGIIALKEGLYRVGMRRARQTGSSALRADAWHHRSDAVTSVAAFLGIGLARIFGPGWAAADDWAALFAAGFIAWNAWRIFRPAWGEFMDEQRHEELRGRIEAFARSVPDVHALEQVRIRKSGLVYHVDLHVEVDGGLSVREGHRIAHRLKDGLLAELPELADVLIHVEPAPEPAPPTEA